MATLLAFIGICRYFYNGFRNLGKIFVIIYASILTQQQIPN